MGRHKDPETLQFIEAVKKKAEILGFKVIDEFKVLNGLFWVDLTLTPYEEGHETYITVEIDTEENDRIYKNLDKIFDLPAKDLEKPYHHFIVIYKGQLTKGNKGLMLEKARLKNVHLFENLKSDQDELEKFYKELEDLKISISEYISRKGSINPAETVKETILGLGKITPVLIVANKPYHIGQATLTSGSQTVGKKDFAMSSGQLFDRKKYKHLAIVAIPREIFTLIIPGTSVALDIYSEQRLNQKATSFTLETCNYPIIIDVELIKGGGGTTVTRIDPEEADAIQLKMFEDLLKGLYEKQKFEIYNQRSQRIFWVEGASSTSYKFSAQWYADVSDIAKIQEVTSTRIPAPEDLTLSYSDHKNIQMIKKIVEQGEISEYFGEVSITATKDIITKMVDLQKTNGNIEGLQATLQESFQPLLKVDVPLGEAVFEFPDMIFKDSLDEIERMIDEIGPEAEVKVVFVPTSSKPGKAIYPKWKKAQEK